MRFHPLWFVLSLLSVTPLVAVPRLRLSNTVVGPVSILQGATAQNQEIEIWSVNEAGLNSETSSLGITFTSTAPWVSAAAQAPRNCFGREGPCIPVRFAFAAQQLPAGTYTATVTVRDPNAIDAPQNVLVIVQIGGGVPGDVNLYVAPNGSVDSYDFSTNSRVTGTISTSGGGDWLSLALNTTGSFNFVQPYRITVRHASGMAAGTYRGMIRTQGSNFAPDNKTVNVNLRVTSEPIADAGTTGLRLRLAADTTKLKQKVAIRNRGMGDLSVASATASTSGGGEWLAAELGDKPNVLTVTFDATGMAPGVFKGNIAVAGNNANTPLNIPVELEVVAKEAPAIRFQGVLDNATFQEGDVLGAGGIVTAFGEQLSHNPPETASSLPLPEELSGARAFVNDQPAPVSATSYDQVTFQIPYDVPRGPGTVRIDRGGERGNSVSVYLLPAVPKLVRLPLRAEGGVDIPEWRDFFAYAVNPDNTISLPREFGIPDSRPTKRGETIVIQGLAFGQTDPPVRAGEAAPLDPPARVPSQIARVLFGALALATGAPQDALFVGLAPGKAGVYQIKVTVPLDSPIGDVPVRVQLDTVASEYALIAVE